MTAIAPTHDDRAVEFADAVRARLADLPADEVDELLDGLQADLADRLADGGELGDPDAYAEELRQAAGLPPRAASARARRNVRESARDTRIALAERFRAFWGATPARRALRDFAVALRPLWWVVRGLVLAWVVLVLGWGGGIGLLGVLIALALVVVSVQWGRGMWASKRWLVVLRRIANAIALILLIPVLGFSWSFVTPPQYVQVDSYGPEGLSLNGDQISNIFAYDCLGQPIDVVQLYDQRGNPITTRSEWGPLWGWEDDTGKNVVYAPNGLAEYAGSWNAFPLNEARAAEVQDPEALAKRAQEATWPAPERQPLSAACKAAAQEAATQTEDPAGAPAGSGADEATEQ